MREELPLQAEDYWPEDEVDFEDDEFSDADLEDWPLEEDVRRLLDER
jgi:hypothetical protein